MVLLCAVPLVKIRAEDGRRVEAVDISPFISNLPYGKAVLASLLCSSLALHFPCAALGQFQDLPPSRNELVSVHTQTPQARLLQAARMRKPRLARSESL